MELKARCYLVGTERIENSKDESKPYLRVSVLQDVDGSGTPDTLSVSSLEVFEKLRAIKRFSEVNLLFEYIQTPKFSMFRIKDVLSSPEVSEGRK